MPRTINNSSPEKDNGNIGHRKEKSRNSRGTVRTEVQVPGSKTRGRGRKSDRAGNGGQRSTRHGTGNEPKKHRSPDQLGHRDNSVPERNSGLATDTLRTEITKKRAQDLLERIAKDQLLNNPNAILRSDDGIHAFGRYTIIKSQHGYQIFRGATLAAEPTSNKVAISWCVADKYGKHSLAQSLIFLDLEIERRVNEIAYYQHTISNTDDLQKKYVVSDRLRESTARLKYAREQLDKCLNSAKYWQQKGFKDETARFGLKNQNTPKPEGI